MRRFGFWFILWPVSRDLAQPLLERSLVLIAADFTGHFGEALQARLGVRVGWFAGWHGYSSPGVEAAAAGGGVTGARLVGDGGLAC